MKRFLNFWMEVKPACSKDFNLPYKFINYLKALRKTIQPLSCSTVQLVKVKAFTLAETLIVIGIIGVVAALTLPNLNHATGDKEKVTRVKKIYSALTDAVDRAQVIYGEMDTWFTDLSTIEERNERAAKRITEFMKVSKDCGFGEGCFSVSASTVKDGLSARVYSNYLVKCLQEDKKAYMVKLSDETSLAFYAGWFGGTRLQIIVDIDGPNKGNNMEGGDLFNFTVYFGSREDSIDEPNVLVPSAEADYIRRGGHPISYFTAWVIDNGNLDYLKCPKQLEWKTQTSCK